MKRLLPQLTPRHLPFATFALLAILQRTPAVRVAASAGEALVASPLGSLLRSAIAGVASLGAVHALAGATQFTFNRNPPDTNGNIGTPITPLVFTVTGATVPPGSFRVTGLPPGVVVTGVNGNGVLNASSGLITGTPTVAGTFQASILAFQFNNAQGDTYGPALVTFVIAGGPNAPPAFTTQPASQTVEVGAAVTLTAAASGSPPPAFQWQRNNANIPGATTSSLVIASALAADAGDYRVIATNLAGTATSNVARLTVTSPPPPTDPNARLANLSVRTSLAAGQNLIFGVVVGGGSRDVLVRAAGPALANFGLTGVMAD
ncbi:MAG: immunoglobulin domain-containing protein, partial [Opitutaceae bacterium]|nr:immunoglobulin domain-containing protein [Opitutaceae bacterium]